MTALTLTQLEQSDLAGGWPAALVPTDAAIQMAESSGNPSAIGPGGSWGTEQIQPQAWPQFAPTSDPVQQAADALQIEHQQGLGAWTTYTTGAYQQFLGAAQAAFPAAAAAASTPGLPASDPSPAAAAAPNPATDLGSGVAQAITNGGEDLRALVQNNIVALAVAGGVTAVLMLAIRHRGAG